MPTFDSHHDQAVGLRLLPLHVTGAPDPQRVDHGALHRADLRVRRGRARPRRPVRTGWDRFAGWS